MASDLEEQVARVEQMLKYELALIEARLDSVRQKASTLEQFPVLMNRTDDRLRLLSQREQLLEIREKEIIDRERALQDREEDITELERKANMLEAEAAQREKSAQDRERNLQLQVRAVPQREYDYGRREALRAQLALEKLGKRTCCKPWG